MEQLVALLRRVSSRSLRAHPNILQGLLRLVVFAALADEHHMHILIDFFIPLDFARYQHIFSYYFHIYVSKNLRANIIFVSGNIIFVSLFAHRFNVQRSEEQQHRLENFIAIVSSIEVLIYPSKFIGVFVQQ